MRPLGDDGGESPLHLFVDDAVLRQDTLRMAAGEIDDAVVDLLQHPGEFVVASPLPLEGIGFREGGDALGNLDEPRERLDLPRFQRFSPNPQGRTWMTVFPARRSVALKVTTASSRAEILPMFVRNRPSRTRWTISLS